jgi:pimeloyl-ACP methyl ester carboxylesterase
MTNSNVTNAPTTLNFAYETIDGQEIAYYETGKEDGPVIVFIHGNSSSSKTFHKQLTDNNLYCDYKLVALDLPGFGCSELASDFSGGIAEVAVIVANFLQQKGYDDGIIVGWSLGGNLAFEMSANLPNAKGYFLYGAPPLGSPADMATAFLPNPVASYGFTKDLTSDQMDEYVASFFLPGTTEAPFYFRDDIRVANGLMRQILGASIAGGLFFNEITIVENMTVPLAILQGEEDQLVNGAYYSTLTMPTLWKNKVFVIDDSGHAIHYERSRKFSKLLKRFAQDVFSN